MQVFNSEFKVFSFPEKHGFFSFLPYTFCVIVVMTYEILILASDEESNKGEVLHTLN